jgi:hypothetical protein
MGALPPAALLIVTGFILTFAAAFSYVAEHRGKNAVLWAVIGGIVGMLALNLLVAVGLLSLAGLA